MKYICEDCGKETEADNKFSHFIKCKHCGGRAFDGGEMKFKPCEGMYRQSIH